MRRSQKDVEMAPILYIPGWEHKDILRMCPNRYSNPGVAKAGEPHLGLSLIRWKPTSQQKKKKPFLFFLATEIFQARWLDRDCYLQCSHLDKVLVFSGAVCQAPHSWQQETAGALDLCVVATCSDGTGDTFRCARCRWEKLRLWLMLWDQRDMMALSIAT